MDAGLVRVLTIEDNETRYDIDTSDHGHFKCEKCGGIYDFKINIDNLNPVGLDNFKVTDRSVYFKGICESCLIKSN